MTARARRTKPYCDQEIADADDDLGIYGYSGAGLGQDRADLGDDHGEHEDHHRQESHDDESRIYERAADLGGQLVGAVQIIGQIWKVSFELAGFFAGLDHGDVEL